MLNLSEYLRCRLWFIIGCKILPHGITTTTVCVCVWFFWFVFCFFLCVCCCVFFCCCFNISYESKWKKRNCYWPTQGELHTKINSNRVASTWVTFNVIWNGWLPLWGCYSEWHWLIQTVLRICVKIASIFSLLSRWKFKDIIFFINLVILLFFYCPKVQSWVQQRVLIELPNILSNLSSLVPVLAVTLQEAGSPWTGHQSTTGHTLCSTPVVNLESPPNPGCSAGLWIKLNPSKYIANRTLWYL